MSDRKVATNWDGTGPLTDKSPGLDAEMEMERAAQRGHAGPADRYAHYQHFERESADLRAVIARLQAKCAEARAEVTRLETENDRLLLYTTLWLIKPVVLPWVFLRMDIGSYVLWVIGIMDRARRLAEPILRSEEDKEK